MRGARSPWRRAFARGTASLLAVMTLFTMRPALGAPADVFQNPAPVIGADPPKAADIRVGDATVATQTGALQYSYPIQVPPGRSGAAPKLALSYSSQAPVHGTLASGWTLGIPEIREDSSEGRLRTRSMPADDGQSDPRADDLFVSTLAGGARLVPVTESWTLGTGVYRAYRAAGDSSFARYERMDTSASYRWRVLTTDGSTLYFGDTAKTPFCRISDQYAPLTRTVDAFGNEVSYEYTFDARECRLTRISYGQNASASLSTFAEVILHYDEVASCGGVATGSKLDYRTGEPIVTGARALTKIEARAIDPAASNAVVHRREISLEYSSSDLACDLEHAPVRLLRSIQESAWGTNMALVELPAIEFLYNDRETTLVAESQSSTPWETTQAAQDEHNLAWGYRNFDDRWPTVEAMMLDVDGDGLLDRVINAFDGSSCQAKWYKAAVNSETGLLEFSGSGAVITLPQLKWRGAENASGACSKPPWAGATAAATGTPHFEGCALNGQVTAYTNSTPISGSCHDAAGTSCSPGSTTCPNGRECPQGRGNLNTATTPDRTYLAYRWLDMDADGLVDLVTAVHGDIDAYDIERGNAVDEDCNYHDEPALFGTWPACPSETDTCVDLGECLENAYDCTGDWCVMDWGDVNSCMANADEVGCYDLMLKPAGGGGVDNVIRAPYMRCGGYPWFIYKNLGDGEFDATAKIKYQPIPLEAESGESSMSGMSVSTQDHAIIDLDGDGRLDAVAHADSAAVGPPMWFVFPGEGDGGFSSKLYPFPTRPGPDNMISGNGGLAAATVESAMGLFDLNADGLPDHWLGLSGGNANVSLHDGERHLLYLPSTFETGSINTSASPVVKPGSDIVVTSSDPAPHFNGSSRASNRVVDVDGDGRLDVVSIGTSSATVYFNSGEQFITPGVAYAGDQNGLRRKTISSKPADKTYWRLVADLIDLDGDGIAEGNFIDATTGELRRAKPASAQPPRLLKEIKNNRGATTTITYASMQTPGVVKQDAGSFWSDGRPKASPQTQWVVSKLESTDSFSSTDAETEYEYWYPRHGVDPYGHYSFRGFETVITTGPTGATTTQRYAYDPDWSGRLVETVVAPVSGETTVAGEIRSFSQTDWEPRTLFGGALTTYHAVQTRNYVCANGQTQSSCSSSPAAFTRTTSTLTALPTSNSLIWAETESLLQGGQSAADGDRKTVMTHAVSADATTYRIRGLTTTKQHKVSGSFVTYAKSAQSWDSTYRVPLTDEVWVDTVDNNRSITTRTYDMTTGNVTSVENARGKITDFEYDARKLFVIEEDRPYNVDDYEYQYDYGTGTRFWTRGPLWAYCVYGVNAPSCPNGVNLKSITQLTLDGLGRVTEKYDSFVDNPTYGYYVLKKTEMTTYVDSVISSAPTSVTHKKAIDEYSSTIRYTQDKTELDGHGRPIKKTSYVFGSAQNDAVTTFTYSADGRLTQVQVPDPAANDTSRVSYDYTFDSLGRATSIRRPDSTTPSNRSGVNVSYDGLTKTTEEITGAAAGNAARTKTTADAFGRLVEVKEMLAPSPLTWATTTYSYGPDDHVREISDAESNETQLTHDFAGRRTAITRGDRVWSYVYDENGNVIAETTPCPPNDTTCLATHTTTIDYDDLDRPVWKDLAPRNLSSTDLATFGAGGEYFLYDYNSGNQTGRLAQWQTYAPGASNWQTNQWQIWNAAGQRTQNVNYFKGAGYDTWWDILRSYHVGGGVWTTNHRNAMDGGSKYDVSWIDYDPRGLPKDVWLSTDRGIYWTHPVTTQTRNVAGLVTTRRTEGLTGSMAAIESTWTYDKLGRVASQVVNEEIVGSGAARVVQQDLEYFGNDNPKRLVHWLALNEKDFHYTYDYRHQITGVTESEYPNAFTATYAYGTAGRFATAEVAAASLPNSDVVPRDVVYHYDGDDPEQVTELREGSNAFALYTYDLAGNMITREYPASDEKWEFLYDGKDQLRRVTKKVDDVVTGSEEYWYDSNGQRTQVVTRDASGAHTGAVFFIEDTEIHHDASRDPVKAVAHVSLGTPVLRVDRTSDTDLDVEYQAHGLANSTIAAVDQQSGTINTSMIYGPFGDLIEATNAGGTANGLTVHHRRLNDKIVDEASTLAYYGYRYYDKLSGQWTQLDPLYLRIPELAQLSSPRRSSLGMFSLNNPLRYLDPDGHDSKPNHSGDVCSKNGGGQCTYGEGGSSDSTNTGAAERMNAWRAARAEARQEREEAEARLREAYGDMLILDDLPSTRTYFPGRDHPDKAKALAIGAVVGVAAVVGMYVGSRVAAASPGVFAAFFGRAAGTATVPTAGAGLTVTADMVQRAVANSPMFSQQSAVSLPAVQRYVDRILAGDMAPPIRVSGTTIVDGVHRYVAGAITGTMPQLQQWTAPMAARLHPVARITVDTADWGNR